TVTKCGCWSRATTCPIRITAARRDSRRCWISWRRPVGASSVSSNGLLPSFDLHQLVVLGHGLGTLAARTAEGLRFLDGLRLHLHLAAVGLDHHEAGFAQRLLGVDARRLGRRLFPARRLNRLFSEDRLGDGLRGKGGGMRIVDARRLELVDAPLLLDDRGLLRRMRLVRRLAFAPLAAAALAATSATPAAAVALAFAFRARRLRLLWLLWLLWLLRLLRLRRRLRMLIGLLLLLRRPVLLLLRGPLLLLGLALLLLAALLLLSIAAAALLQAPLLLSVAPLATRLVLAVTATLVAAAVAARVVSVTSMLVAARIALHRLVGRGRNGLHRGRGGCRRGGLEDREDLRQEADAGVRRGGDRLHDGCNGGRGLRRGARRARLRVVDHRRGLRRRDRLHHGLLALGLGLGGLGAGRLRLLRALDHLVARRHVLHLVQLVVTQALHL